MAFIACTDKSGDDTGNSTDSGSGGATFTAQEGVWVLAAATISQDECEIGESITSSGEENFQVDGSDIGLDLTFEGSDPWLCSLSENELDCPAQTTVEDRSDDGIDAVITSSVLLGGSVTSASTMDMSLEVSVSCEGTECMPLAEVEGMVLPCTTVAVSTARAQGS